MGVGNETPTFTQIADGALSMESTVSADIDEQLGWIEKAIRVDMEPQLAGQRGDRCRSSAHPSPCVLFGGVADNYLFDQPTVLAFTTDDEFQPSGIQCPHTLTKALHCYLRALSM